VGNDEGVAQGYVDYGRWPNFGWGSCRSKGCDITSPSWCSVVPGGEALA